MSRIPSAFVLACASLLAAGCMLEDQGPVEQSVTWETHAPSRFTYTYVHSSGLGETDVYSLVATPDSVIAAWRMMGGVGGWGWFIRQGADSVPLTGDFQQYAIASVLAEHSRLIHQDEPPEVLTLTLDSVYGYPRHLEWDYIEVTDAFSFVTIQDFTVLEP